MNRPAIRPMARYSGGLGRLGFEGGRGGIGDADVGGPQCCLDVEFLQLAIERVIKLTAGRGFLRERLQLYGAHVQIAGLILAWATACFECRLPSARKEIFLVGALVDAGNFFGDLRVDRIELALGLDEVLVVGAVLGEHVGIGDAKGGLLLTEAAQQFETGAGDGGFSRRRCSGRSRHWRRSKPPLQDPATW